MSETKTMTLNQWRALGREIEKQERYGHDIPEFLSVFEEPSGERWFVTYDEYDTRQEHQARGTAGADRSKLTGERVRVELRPCWVTIADSIAVEPVDPTFLARLRMSGGG